MPATNMHLTENYQLVFHGEIHNVYGQLNHKTTYEALLDRDNFQRRPFVLTRAIFTGSQQYGPMWTGDNQAEFDELRSSINSILSLGVAGIVYSGSDIPGFFGEPTPQLATNFYQLGVFFPFMRAHSHIENVAKREPYFYDESIQPLIKQALSLRYDLAHYIYWLFYLSSIHGTPLMRPMW